MQIQYKALLLDLGGVLLDWDPNTVMAISTKQLRLMMHSAIWFEMERGTITLDEACEHLGALVGAETSTIKQSLDQAQKSLRANQRLCEILTRLKEANTHTKIYIMSNISREHFKIVQNRDLPWSLIDRSFTSGAAGMRKPDLCFFEHVIDQIGFQAGEVVMLDDQPENICAARSIGIHGIVFGPGSVEVIGHTLRNLFQDSLPRAQEYLKAHAGKHDCVVEGHDVILRDNFAQLMILELTNDSDIIYLKYPSGKKHPPRDANLPIEDDSLAGKFAKDSRSRGDKEINPTISREDSVADDKEVIQSNVENGLWNYFVDHPILTTQEFPADTDTTSTAYLSLPEKCLKGVADPYLVLDKMASQLSPDGIMQTYFCDDRPRTVPEVCSNMLRFFYKFGRGEDARIKKTEDWVVKCLSNRACLYGNRVYTTPETFLYFTARLYLECGTSTLKQRLENITEALTERLNVPTNPLSLALRVSACQMIGIPRSTYLGDFSALLALQEEDGGFPAGHLCRIGRTGVRIGNRGLTTALVTKILKHEQAGIVVR